MANQRIDSLNQACFDLLNLIYYLSLVIAAGIRYGATGNVMLFFKPKNLKCPALSFFFLL